MKALSSHPPSQDDDVDDDAQTRIFRPESILRAREDAGEHTREYRPPAELLEAARRRRAERRERRSTASPRPRRLGVDPRESRRPERAENQRTVELADQRGVSVSERPTVRPPRPVNASEADDQATRVVKVSKELIHEARRRRARARDAIREPVRSSGAVRDSTAPTVRPPAATAQDAQSLAEPAPSSHPAPSSQGRWGAWVFGLVLVAFMGFLGAALGLGWVRLPL